MKLVLFFISFGTSWFEPPSSCFGTMCVGSPTQTFSLLLSYGLEGYLMEAVDVRMDVEALICRCCRIFGIICLETLSRGFQLESLSLH